MKFCRRTLLLCLGLSALLLLPGGCSGDSQDSQESPAANNAPAPARPAAAPEQAPDADLLGILGVPQKPGEAAPTDARDTDGKDAKDGDAARSAGTTDGELRMNISQPSFNADRQVPQVDMPKPGGGSLDY